MTYPANFYQSILNSVTDHIVVIDADGVIQFVNTAWVRFGMDNACISNDWQGVNYLDVCDSSSEADDMHARIVAAGARKIIRNEQDVFYHEYPCHSPSEQRWFMMRITRLQWEGDPRFVISHQNITERKLAELQIEALARVDGLTGVANRRHFDMIMAQEWRRNQRDNTPLSLILLDVDDFKSFNDHYGHQAGDTCLKKIGLMLSQYAQRPGDLAARYGGEEFALILSNTSAQAAHDIARTILGHVLALGIAHDASSTHSFVTASLGIATLHPNQQTTTAHLIELADNALYNAKRNGKNTVMSHAPHNALAQSTRYDPAP